MIESEPCSILMSAKFFKQVTAFKDRTVKIKATSRFAQSRLFYYLIR